MIAFSVNESVVRLSRGDKWNECAAASSIARILNSDAIPVLKYQSFYRRRWIELIIFQLC